MTAPFLLRLKAFMIDYILIVAYLAALFVLSVFLFPDIQHLFNGSLIVAQFAGFLMVTLPISLYFIISDSVIGGQSFGKKRTGIRVVDENGAALSVIHITFRTILKFLPWELSHDLIYRLIYVADGKMPFNYYFIGGLIYLLIFAYILTAIFTKKKQSLYDIMTKAQVVKVSS
ncbi:RDD family protein [Bacillus aquiflavi]|uniref:RDD family protein n=1 Tax=Bacillus aquiflavi TaxID=2672567 RepID=A0A6B3W4S6_9BACI|nr:RDD family protein [Bacillus aquiflavi]MBA4538144.1 RDD family protein [Bacillus aquiflavi]NEY82464.1 RDD family protein [Bacillus aquiflavi]UAC48564.1 RDD family protein [Bacillus aquiflavi]